MVSRIWSGKARDVHNVLRNRRPVTDIVIHKTDEHIRADKSFLTIDEVYQRCPEMLRTALHETVENNIGLSVIFSPLVF